MKTSALSPRSGFLALNSAPLLFGVLSLLAGLILAPKAGAVTYTWNGNGSSVNWGVSGNWTGGTPVSASTTDLIFAGTNNTGTLGTPLNQNIATPFLFQSLTFDATAGNFFLGGGQLAIVNGSVTSIVQSSASSQSIANAITHNGSNSAGTLRLDGDGTGVVTLSGVISNGSGQRTTSILKSGDSTFVLSGTNTFGGTTTIQAGNLVVGANAPSGSNGALGNATSAVVLGNGSTLASEAPALLINGAFTVGRAITVGSIANAAAYNAILGGSNTSGTATYTGDITFSNTAANYTATLQAATGGTVNFNPGNWTTNNKAITIGSAGNTGTVTISKELITSGGVTVNFGTLRLVTSSTFGDSTPVTVAGGTFNLDTFGETVGAFVLDGGSVIGTTGKLNTTGSNFTFRSGSASAVLEGSAGLLKTTTGTATVSGVNLFSGATTIQAGSLVVGANAPSGSSGALGSASSAVVLGNGSTLAGDAPALLINGAFTVGRAITVGSIANAAAYNAIIGGSNTSGISTFSGAITLSTTAANYTATLQAATGGTVNFTNTWTTNNKLISIGSAGNTGTVQISNTLSTTGGLSVLFGKLQTDANNRIGDTTPLTVNGGTFDIRTFTDTVGAVSLVAGSIEGTTGVLTGSSYAVQSGSISAILGGSGALTKSTGGTVTLSGVNTFSGASTIQNGTLSVSNVAAATSNQALGANTTLNLGVASTSSGTLNYTGGAGTLGKTINVLGNGSDTIQNSGTGLFTLSGSIVKNGTVLTLMGGMNGITVSGVISGASAGSDLIIDGGTINLTNANTYNGPTFIRNGGTLNANAANALPTANGRTALTLDSIGTGNSTLALGASQSVASLTGAASSTVNLNTHTLTIGSGSGTTTFAGAINGSGGLIKDGASTQILTGPSNYTGSTQVNGGALIVNNGTGSGTGSGSLLIGGTSSLGGNGIIGGASTVLGIHTPGNSAGIQTFNSDLTYGNGMGATPSVVWELFGNTDLLADRGATMGYDGINVAGALSFLDATTLNLIFNGSGSMVSWADSFWTSNRSWLFYSGASSLNNFGNLNLNSQNWNDSTSTGFNDYFGGLAAFSVSNVGNDVYLNFGIIPEPSRALLGLLGLLSLGLRRRRA